ncbi:topless-related protein 3-like isoform X2 [Ipomoea triloba]|uniref:topless-related protein 3-like isoform X2 n=1 Tax=Ipomoea triloba TaxID=35885 RepID=UPI00125E5D4B|nr:topless-related protein 3-like isoform X2 [Ipomoea triloba]
MASTSSSVTAWRSTQGWTYDVFLNFRGPDIRKTFIDFLYESLVRKGIRTFQDDNRLEKGDCITPSLIKGIEESQFFITVFSKGYASSKWCLEELATIMELQEKFRRQTVVPVFYDVEPTDVRNQKGSFEDWFKTSFLKDEKEEMVRRWKEALKRAGSLKGFEAKCAENVAADIHARLNQATLAYEENLVGLESRVNNICKWLRWASDNDDDDVRFIGICGMEGIGRDTTELWELTEIVDQVQCQMVSMPECSDAKVSRLLYTNSGVGILALSSNGTGKLWKLSYNKQNPSRKNWQPNTGTPTINDVPGVNLEETVPCIAVSNDDFYVVSAAGKKVSLFNIMSNKVTKTKSLPSASTFLAFDPHHDNNIIAIGMKNSSIYICDWVNEELLIELNEHREPITGLAFSTKLKMLVSADADAQLCVWNTNLWEMRSSVHIQLPDGEVPSGGDTQVMFHVDQVHLLVTHETQLAIYDASKMELIHQCIPHASLSARISSATYSCNSQLIYASFIDGNIGVLDADTLRLKSRVVPSAYLPHQLVLNGSKDVYPLVIAAHPQEPNQFAVGLTNGSIKVIEPLESQGNWEVSVSSPVDNGKKNGRLVWQVLCRTLGTMCLGLFGVGIIPIIQTKTRKSKMNFDGYMTDSSRTNKSDGAEQGEPNQPKVEPSARPQPIKSRL